MSVSISSKIASFVNELSLTKVPPDVVMKAKLHILDTMGVALATPAMKDPEIEYVIRVLSKVNGDYMSSVWGRGFKSYTPFVAMINSVQAHFLDYDDTHLGSTIHVSSVVVPTAFAVGEVLGSSGSRVLEAVIAGYEVTTRLGLLTPTAFHMRGFHPTSVVGVFGATVTAGKLLGLSEEQLVNALGIAGSMSSGILQAIPEGVRLKPLHPGIASMNGILAALLAREGLKGPRGVFEGEQGFYKAYLGESIDVESLTFNTWETMNIAIKPYPSCHATHSAIDIAIALHKDYNLRPDNINEITFYAPKLTIRLVMEPMEEKLRPSTPYSAKFSLPYTVMVALRKGWIGVWDFSYESIRDEEILKHTPKVKAVYEPAYDKLISTGVIPVKAKVSTKEGNIYEIEVIDHLGTPKKPMSVEDVIRKFEDNTKYLKIAKGTLINKILELEKIRNIEEIIDLIKG
jgi:2-methylcitrate dehydratase PrpD